MGRRDAPARCLGHVRDEDPVRTGSPTERAAGRRRRRLLRERGRGADGGRTGVLGNDSDEDGDPLTAVVATGVSNGSVALDANGSLTYTPAPNFNGVDSFTYRANDGEADSNLATVAITVDPFEEPRQTLTVTKIGNARITSSPAGIDCGDVCSADFELGTVVTLTAMPDPGWTFAGWGGACGGSATCVVTVAGGKTVTASFDRRRRRRPRP